MEIRSTFGRSAALLVVGITVLAACGSSGGSKGASSSGGGTVRVTSAWARDTAPSQTNDAVYLTVVNGTGTAVTLTGASVPATIAKSAALHKTTTGMSDSSTTMGMDEDMTTMTEVKSVNVPAHGTFTFKPGHYHIMLEDLAGALTAHQTFPITLTRGDGATLRATVTVRGV
jgi:copper(I)-binding protein